MKFLIYSSFLTSLVATATLRSSLKFYPSFTLQTLCILFNAKLLNIKSTALLKSRRNNATNSTQTAQRKNMKKYTLIALQTGTLMLSVFSTLHAFAVNVPEGPYRNTCSHCVINNNVLKCECDYNHYGNNGKQWTSINTEGCETFVDVNGELFCKGVPTQFTNQYGNIQQQPKGDYKNTCPHCRFDSSTAGEVLTCYCQSKHKFEGDEDYWLEGWEYELERTSILVHDLPLHNEGGVLVENKHGAKNKNASTQSFECITEHQKDLSEDPSLLSAAHYLRNLEKQWLDLSTSHIQDIKPLLPQLKNITFLELYNNPIQDFKPLTQLPKLKWLGLDQQQISQLDAHAVKEGVMMLDGFCEGCYAKNAPQDILYESAQLPGVGIWAPEYEKIGIPVPENA